MIKIKAKTSNKIGLIGKTLKHSYSKDLFECVFRHAYYLYEMDDVAAFLNKRNFFFVNVTYPYKQEVIKYLDCTSDLVKETGVCNLIVNRKGRLFGYNTDVAGFNWLIVSNSIVLNNKTVLILGNGATAKTVTYCLKQTGVKKIIIGCRHKKVSTDLYFSDVPKIGVQIIINATPVGQSVDDPELVNLRDFPDLETYIDLVYNPRNTNLMFEAKTLGKGAVSGLQMLVKQAQMSFSIATSELSPTSVWNTVKGYIEIKNTNIVFIGMPTSGKSQTALTISKLFMYSIKPYDTDVAVEKMCNASISQIFKSKGEAYFRRKESEAVNKIYRSKGFLISTGGGLIMNQENYRKLSYNGIFVYLKKTNFDDFVDNGDRPLIKTKSDIIQLYNERKSTYEKCADITVPWDSDSSAIVSEVFNALDSH